MSSQVRFFFFLEKAEKDINLISYNNCSNTEAGRDLVRSSHGLPCKFIREKKVVMYVLHQRALQLLHNFKNTFEVVKLKSNTWLMRFHKFTTA